MEEEEQNLVGEGKYTCLYCDNPSSKAVTGEKLLRRKGIIAGLRSFLNIGVDKSEEVTMKIIADSKFVTCISCSKTYYVLCNSSGSAQCLNYAMSLIDRTDLVPGAGLEEVENFMSNEKIHNKDLFNNLTAVTAVSEGKNVHLDVIFGKYYATLSKREGSKFRMEHMYFLDKDVGGGNFLEKDR